MIGRLSRRSHATRDTIEETANVRGIPVVFVDTAGLREAGDEIEEEGIRRSRASWRKPNWCCTCSTSESRCRLWT